MAQNINKQTIVNLLKDKNFEELFISELLWNRPVNTTLPSVVFNGGDYIPKSVAQKNGLEVLECILPKIPTPTECKAIDASMRRIAKDYIAIYHTSNGSAQVWAAPIKKEERIQVVCINIDDPDKNADYFCPKINMLAFGIEEDDITIIDVKDRVQKAFAVNSEKITKSFYDGFKKEHKSFAAFIEGIDDQISGIENKNKQWYASIMLNRLMFCYFIQKKGFLDNNPNYLIDKLKYVKENEGEDKYFSSFYRGFLRRLFSEGLNTPGRATEFMEKFGNIPYLNGGLFDTHIIETQYTNIEIPDKAFENLFTFFDNWNWCLDTRVTATGRDINPDVLGYIFEQYINDRAQMGAYYTKEDITGYIAKNCIIPFIFDKMTNTTSAKDFRPNGYVWQKLKTSGTDYIYDAMKFGLESYPDNIPQDIAQGIDTTAPDLLQRRRLWNNPAPAKIALPTETWREAIDRWSRCKNTEKLIANGSITNANDLITNNLNILQFAIDLIHNVDMQGNYLFVKHFYEILKSITILDPTCGSGAFLFAALNILEPLYEECIDKMNQCPENFEKELEEIRVQYRSNNQYFIFKSIILRNLYGVDIMPEAIEVAKLRLFLKLVAVVECNPRKENLGLDPLPDIDFNIRCGNTLVGYANQNELEKANMSEGFFNAEEFRDKVEFEMEKISVVYKRYRDIQLKQKKEERNEDFVKSKKELQERLSALNQILNQRLYSLTPKLQKIDQWVAQAQPFHWIAEFYEIIQNGGFDVIIGNPPYVVYTKKDSQTKKAICDKYTIYNYKTIECNNLYAFVMERATQILNSKAMFGMIIPISSVSNPQFAKLRKLMIEKSLCWFSSYSNRPGKLFLNVEQRLTIFISKISTNLNKYFSSNYHHWYGIERTTLFDTLSYVPNIIQSFEKCFNKIGSDLQLSILNKVFFKKDIRLGNILTSNQSQAYYHNGPTYFIRSMPFMPNSGQNMIPSSHYKVLNCTNNYFVSAILNSSLYYWFYKNYSNCRDFSDVEITPFPIGKDIDYHLLDKLSKELELSYKEKCVIKNRDYNGSITYYEEYYPAKSKPIIDEIDTLLASHYGFTEEELDFIINYDIKYRMGDELVEE